MQRRKRIVVAGVAAAGLIAGGAAVAIASGGDDAPIAGDARDRAVAAALEHVGQGTVTETEVGDGGAGYGVEVRLPDGSQVEVRLDEGFHVIGTDADDDGAGDVGGAEDD